MRIKNLHTYLVAVFIILGFSVFGQMANYKSLYLYNFVKRIEWPVSNEHPNEFHLIVFGDEETASAINQIALTKKAGSREIIVKHITNLADIGHADLIFVGYSKRKELEELTQLIQLSPILLVADYKNAELSDINLIETDNGLEFIIRPESIRNKGLKLSDSLILLGKQDDD